MSFSWELFVDERPAVVMGVVNVTPDSFSDGGRYLDPGAAVAHGLALVQAGADLLDVGGESSRPGAAPVDEGEERARVLPVIRRLVAEAGVPISVDTTKAAVADAAADAGALVVNDVSAGRHDPRMLGVVAAAGTGFVAMHMQGEPRTMQLDPRYGDVVDDVAAFLEERLSFAVAAGIPEQLICLDPGIGFGKTPDQNLELVRRLDRIVAIGRPVLVGLSRKSVLGKLLGDPTARTGTTDASVGAAVAAFARGASLFRVHDVQPHVEALAAAAAVERGALA